MLLFYDIRPEIDRRGARVRLVRLLRRKGGLPIQRSTWLLPAVDEELLRLLDEIRAEGGAVFLCEWKPIPLHRVRTSGEILQAGMVLQGPKPIDEGMADRILHLLEEWGVRTKIRISGAMGRVAALDRGWGERGEIGTSLLPSQALDELSLENPDLLILLTGCKSLENGFHMGRKIVENARLVRLLRIPLTQVEVAGKGAVIHWAGDPSLSRKLAASLSLDFRLPPPFTGGIERKGGRIYRALVGVRPGEKILVNGYVVGESLSHEVTLVARGGRLEEIVGGKKYPRGIQKVGKVDLTRATVKTLRTLHIPSARAKLGKKGDRVVLVERADTALERAQGAGLVVAVGDDTTTITHEILSRLGIPVLGLVDGDADGLLEKSGGREESSGLYLVRVSPGMDDEAGRILKERVFRGRTWIRMRGNPEGVKRRVLETLGELVQEVVTA
ncbi:MAG: DUF2117 domain-containing protein [Candidatus Hadarchaeales archaeon]